MFDVVDVPDELRYEARLDGAVAGRVEYDVVDGAVELLHTEVDPAFEGQGVGSRLAAGVFDDLRGRGVKVVVRCPFLRRWLEKHPDVAEQVTVRA
jgi:predicted GNAT family acetyltransferase